MWVRKGVLHIIDLGRDYYLVTFSHKDNLVKALLEGPWLIFDHYLVVKKWCPDFDPATAAIEKVSVWLRFSGLPIEYYDYDVLKFRRDARIWVPPCQSKGMTQWGLVVRMEEDREWREGRDHG